MVAVRKMRVVVYRNANWSLAQHRGPVDAGHAGEAERREQLEWKWPRLGEERARQEKVGSAQPDASGAGQGNKACRQ